MLDTEIYRSHRYAFEFSLIFIDLDHFKSVNDTHGHLVGSKLLAEIGEAVKEKCRLIDLAFRYGYPDRNGHAHLIVTRRTR